MLGDYRIVDNVLVCVLHKQAVKKVKIFVQLFENLCFAVNSAQDDFFRQFFVFQFVTGVSSETMLVFYKR
jgi:hypothetical protein